MAATNRIHEYQQRRAVALDYQEKQHDLHIEARLRNQHGHHATGPRATLIRQTLTKLAHQTANEGAVLPPGGTPQTPW